MKEPGGKVGLYVLTVMFCAVLVVIVVYYGRDLIVNSLFTDPATSRPFQFIEPKAKDSGTQWQQLIAAIAIGFEVLCITIAFATQNHLFIYIGVVGAGLFASLLFYRQIQEKIAIFQGTSPAAIADIPIYPTPKNAVEESTFLRFLVFLLGEIGIFSLDHALQSSFAPIALPILICGSIWSYQRRHHSKSIPNRIAFFVSLALTLACLFGTFLGQLQQVVEQNRDGLTPFLIALILISLHLFRGAGLYLRKDLSIAVLRSVLMVGVAAAVNKNLSFLWFGGIFLALLLPTLVLLYRSTLQLPPSKAKNLPWHHLAQIALVTILLGSILALFAPHFRLSQLGIKLPEIEQIAGQLPVLDPNQTSGQTQDSADPTASLSGDASEQIEQATKNILATADRPLPTSSAQATYLIEYLRTHMQVSGQPHSQSQLVQSFTAPCPANYPACYGDRNFVGSRAQFDQLSAAMLNSTNLQTRWRPATDPSGSQVLETYLPNQGWVTVDSLTTQTSSARPLATPFTPSIAPTPQLTPAQTAQLQTLQQDLETLSTQAPQLSPQELSTVQEQLASVQTQLQQSSVANTASNPIGSIAPSPQAVPLTEQITALQSTIDSLKNQPRPAASVAANPSPNPQLAKLQQQLKATQSKVSEKIAQAQSSPAPSVAPSKPPLTPEQEKKLQEQWTNIARVAMVILMITGGMIWYLRRQGTQERKQKAKRRQFEQLPQVEKLYRLMLKDLAQGQSLRRPPQTELEYSRIQQLRCSSPIYKLIAEISADYVAWRYGNQSVNELALAEKFRRFQELYQQELARKSPSFKKS
jgi:hypothetical protein